jgi:SAM-dependent methyltransferase
MLKLHLGCGTSDFGPDWIHIDARHIFDGVVVLRDEEWLNLPFALGSAEMVYCCHALTYWDWDDSVRLLSHWRDLLCDGGIVRLSVPDFASICRVYKATGDMRDIIGVLMGRMTIDGQLRYYKSAHDAGSLRGLLRRAGFRQNAIRRWNMDDWLEQDRAKRRDCSVVSINGEMISLNMEARK